MLKKNDIEPFLQRNREQFDGTLRMNLKPKIGDENGNLIGNDPMREITRVVPSMRNLARKKNAGSEMAVKQHRLCLPQRASRAEATVEIF
jgi:hypothetical protein